MTRLESEFRSLLEIESIDGFDPEAALNLIAWSLTYSSSHSKMATGEPVAASVLDSD